VFTLSGKPITRSVFGHKWRTAVKAAGLPAGTGFHSLRHYYASLLIRHGERTHPQNLTTDTLPPHTSAESDRDTHAPRRGLAPYPLAGSQRRYGTCWLASGDTISTWDNIGLAA
jgi:integrase